MAESVMLHECSRNHIRQKITHKKTDKSHRVEQLKSIILVYCRFVVFSQARAKRKKKSPRLDIKQIASQNKQGPGSTREGEGNKAKRKTSKHHPEE
jgi:hypothetical protein